jgi:hypothetical protein
MFWWRVANSKVPSRSYGHKVLSILKYRRLPVNTNQLVTTMKVLPSSTMKSFVRIEHMLVYYLGHLKHVNPLQLEDLLHWLVTEDVAFIAWILQVVGFDVCPELLCDLWSRELAFAIEKSGELMR